jgi:hypothetical protein
MKRVNMKRSFLVVSLATLMFTSLAGYVVYDPDPYPRYYYRDSYSRPYYYRDRYWGD